MTSSLGMSAEGPDPMYPPDVLDRFFVSRGLELLFELPPPPPPPAPAPRRGLLDVDASSASGPGDQGTSDSGEESAEAVDG